MNVIGCDFDYAVMKKVETTLWTAHSFLNGEYRKAMGRLTSQNQVVVKRKVEKSYREFLRTSQSFYRVYVQQLSGRFYIPELHHIAKGTDVEPGRTPAPDSTPPPFLGPMILKSCQITLVRLGDLVRYRCQMSDKPSNGSFNKALEYYGLANALDPNDGSAHHQMAVLSQLGKRQLDIVYYFYRSVSIETPYTLGMTNLARAFKNLDSPPSEGHGQFNQSDAMVNWFLRLHGFFFQGEPFSQQAELEEEVLHRTELSMKSGGDDSILRKMTLINIAAYDVALEKVGAGWTIQGSQSAQFILRFNIRTVMILLRLLKSALLDGSKASSISDTTSQGDDDSLENIPDFNNVSMKLFPLVRLYISWIYVTKTDSDKYRKFLEPYISDVYSLLADTLTLLNGSIDQAATTPPSQYLLAEDTEAIGLRPFNSQDLPLFLRVEGLPVMNSTKTAARKPRQKTVGYRCVSHTEAVWRIRDILYCGVLLASTPSYPLVLTINHHAGRDMECWTYTEYGPPPSKTPMDRSSMERMVKKLKLGEPKTKEEGSTSHSGIGAMDQTPGSDGVSDVTNSTAAQDWFHKAKSGTSSPLLDTDLSGDSEMVNMVNKLLDPAESSRPQSSQTQTDETYGMNTTMANEIFGGLATDSAQPSPKSKTIPSLPWDYFFAPSPRRSDSQGNNQLTSGSDYVPRSAHGQLDGFESSAYLNNLGSRNPQTGVGRNAEEDHDNKSLGVVPKTPANSGQPSWDESSFLESKESILNSLQSSLYTQHGLKNIRTPADYWANRPNARTHDSALGNQYRTNFPSYPRRFESPYVGSSSTPNPVERPASLRAGVPHPQGPHLPPGAGQPGPWGSSFPDPYGHFGGTPSPAGNNVGLPRPGSRGPSRGPSRRNTPTNRLTPQERSQWPQGVRSDSALAFSHPSSSLWGNTPAGRSGGPANAPANAVYSNGNYFNASTPFGRLGPGANNRDDPTHFRNRMRGGINSYSKQVLAQALVEEDEKSEKK